MITRFLWQGMGPSLRIGVLFEPGRALLREKA